MGNPDVAGFIGTSQFPIANAISIATDVTYFLDVARKRPDDGDLPWGIAANLIVGRPMELTSIWGGKGSGRFYAAPNVVATHPWWNDGGKEMGSRRAVPRMSLL